MNNIDKIDEKKFFKPCKEDRTRGHTMRVQKTQCKSLVRRNTFSQRVVNDWNALPDAVVTSGSINQFKGRLGRWWKNDPIMYQNIRSPQAIKHSAIALYNAREGHQPCWTALQWWVNGESMATTNIMDHDTILANFSLMFSSMKNWNSFLDRMVWHSLCQCQR